MEILFCGVRGSTPAPGANFVRVGGNTSCVALTRSGEDTPSLVLDAGTGLQRLTARLGGAPFKGTLLVTHLHWDHCHGIPFFRSGDQQGAEVTMLIPDQQDGRKAADVLAGAMAPPCRTAWKSVLPLSALGASSAVSRGSLKRCSGTSS